MAKGISMLSFTDNALTGSLAVNIATGGFKGNAAVYLVCYQDGRMVGTAEKAIALSTGKTVLINVESFSFPLSGSTEEILKVLLINTAARAPLCAHLAYQNDQ